MPTAMRDSNRTVVAGLLIAALVVAACGGPSASASSGPSATPEPTATPDPHLIDPASADTIYRALQKAHIDIVANTASTGPNGEPVRLINATFDGWPLLLSEYSSAKALAKDVTWKAGSKPGQGEAPVAIRGLNILIEWGPTTGATPPVPTAAQLQGIQAVVEVIDPLLWPLSVRSTTAVTVPNHAPPPSPAPSGSGKPSASPS